MSKKRKSKTSELKASIVIEHSRINREKSLLVLAKSILLYFSFIFVGVVGFVNGFVDPKLLGVMMVLSVVILILGTFTYFVAVHKEEKFLTDLLEEDLKGGRG